MLRAKRSGIGPAQGDEIEDPAVAADGALALGGVRPAS